MLARYHGGAAMPEEYDPPLASLGRFPSMSFNDYVGHERAVRAGLQRHHVLALRLYTTSTYSSINRPLRELAARMSATNPNHPHKPTVQKEVRESSQSETHPEHALPPKRRLGRNPEHRLERHPERRCGGRALAPLTRASAVRVLRAPNRTRWSRGWWRRSARAAPSSASACPIRASDAR